MPFEVQSVVVPHDEVAVVRRWVGGIWLGGGRVEMAL